MLSRRVLLTAPLAALPHAQESDCLASLIRIHQVPAASLVQGDFPPID